MKQQFEPKNFEINFSINKIPVLSDPNIWKTKEILNIDPYKNILLKFIESGYSNKILLKFKIPFSLVRNLVYEISLGNNFEESLIYKIYPNNLTSNKIWKERLMFEWDFYKNEIPTGFCTSKSDKKVYWICNNCNHNWKAKIASRVNGTNCPPCGGRVLFDKNRLTSHSTWEYLSMEWDYELNEIHPSECAYGSHKKIHWICKNCGYNWKAELYVRTKGHGCASCSGRNASNKNRLTLNPNWKYLSMEWDYALNKKPPKDYAYASSKKVHWICKNCGHKWVTDISHRTNGRGCASCAGKIASDKNRLTLHPNWKFLSMEWDYTHNKKPPEMYSYGSKKNIFWICTKCGHKWKIGIFYRIKGYGSGICSGKIVSNRNRLTLHSTWRNLSKEWDYKLNEEPPENYSYASNKKVHWICKDCDYNWKAKINNRINCKVCKRYVWKEKKNIKKI